MAKLKYKDLYKPSKNLEEFKKKHPKSKFLGLYEKSASSNIRDEAQKEIDKKVTYSGDMKTKDGKIVKVTVPGYEGKWVTMKGRRVFIGEGEDPKDALNKSLAWEKKNKRRSSVNKNNRDWNK